MPDISITAYLQYLHEVSRKILQRSGFDNVLYGKSKRDDPSYFDLRQTADQRNAHVRQVAAKLKTVSGRGIYAGFGLLVGTVKVASRGGWRPTRRIAAPLCYCPIELPDDEETVDAGHTFAWNLLSLNYDLFTLLLENFDEEEPPEGQIVGSPGVSSESLRSLALLEGRLNSDARTPKFQRKLREGGGLSDYLEPIRSSIAGCRDIADAQSRFDRKLIDAYAAEPSLQYFDQGFLFVAAVPDQLSATVALRQLIQESELGRFRNPLLEKVFLGVLRNEEVKIADTSLGIDSIQQAITRIPMPLSERQHAAIHNAWGSEISYIQGPPGTGKSHTITALMLSALMLGKRVLMVSHKPAAVEIVRTQLERTLGPDSVVYLGADVGQRRALRGTLRAWLNDVSVVTVNRKMAERARRREELEREVATLAEDAGHLRKKLEHALDAEAEYYEYNNMLIRAREEYVRSLDIVDAHSIQLPRSMPNEARLKSALQRAYNILRAPNGSMSRLDAIYVKRLFAFATHHLAASPDRLLTPRTGVHYLYEHMALASTKHKADRARAQVAKGETATLRRRLTFTIDRLESAKRQLLAAAYQHHVSSKLLASGEQVERFEKMLFWRQPGRVAEAMEAIDFEQVTDTFPLWVGEMRNLGEFLPFASQLFDLVIVDEASQINIAEIIPAFYRGARFCVVGDKKQLGLDAAGLFFLNRTFEQLIWNQFLDERRTSYLQAEERALLVSKSSILDFITCPINRFAIPQTVLNEHFRSLPKLASFTSDHFYRDDGGLVLMTESPHNVRKQCFDALEVGGERNADHKFVANEVGTLIERLKYIIREQGYLVDAKLKTHGYSKDNLPSIGVISFLTEQRNHIRSRVEECFSDEEQAAYKLVVGTPEEFQGNERNIIFLTLGLDGTNRWGKSHYENPNRFNVATSRAKDYTCVIFGGIPENANLIKKYLRHFGATWSRTIFDAEEQRVDPAGDRYAWRYDPEARESEFERRVDTYLHKFMSTVSPPGILELYNQVYCCGGKRLDFVLFNISNNRSCAVEVDGRDHFSADGVYSEEHLARVAILQRAGWQIVHVPYYQWYENGWLCDDEYGGFRNTIDSLFEDLRVRLGLQSNDSSTKPAMPANERKRRP